MSESLMWRIGIKDLSSLLEVWTAAGFPLRDAIDGGACTGEFSQLIASRCSGHVFAFEPLPSNISMFSEHPRVILHQSALSDRSGTERLVVPEIPDGAGSNPLGYLEGSLVGSAKSFYWEKIRRTRSDRIDVVSVRGDDIVPKTAEIDLIKLDLQGGEPRALDGLAETLRSVPLMWVEYTGSQPGLLRRLRSQGFLWFETTYLFRGTPTGLTAARFQVLDFIDVGMGTSGWIGLRKSGWRNFALEFQSLKRRHGLIQTDMICVRDTRIPPLLSAALA